MLGRINVLGRARRRARAGCVAATTLTTAALGLTAAPAHAGPAPATRAPSTAATSLPGGWTPRPATYPKTVTRHDIPIRMSDGTVLRGDLTQPADASGTPTSKKLPVIVTITAYNKGIDQYSGLAGNAPSYLVRRGYDQLTVDARGTGDSRGKWCAFCTREDKDASEVMTWAHNQPWSNGRTAMSGPSYMGIDQIFAASGRPPGLKALFPQVPAADVYRDVVASGGELDVGFIPLWLGLVTFTGVIPPSTPNVTSLSNYLVALIDHVGTAGSFTAPLLTNAVLGGSATYDGPFYKQRSPINVVDKVNVPTFLVSGEYDLFQRGTPLLFENLQKRGVPTKLVIGPWDHLQASAGDGFGAAGLGSLPQMQLRWFDHYVKGMPDPGLAKIAPVSYYEQGTGTWRHTQHWVGSDRVARTWNLSGSATTGSRAGTLTTGAPTAGTADVPPIPVSGLCTRSVDQWTAGLASYGGKMTNPCLTDNSPNDHTGVVFETAPVKKAIRFQGPINAHLYASSTSGDGMLSVTVEDEAPDGKVSRLSAGWQVISLRQLDKAKSRYLDGKLIQPYHPFTKASRHRLTHNQVAPVDVEVFPTGASIQPGHRLRIAIQAFDVPHLLPSLAQSTTKAGIITLHESAKQPSSITLPVVR